MIANPHPDLFPVWFGGRIGITVWAKNTPIEQIKQDLSHGRDRGDRTLITFGTPAEIAAECASWERPPLVVDLTGIPTRQLRQLERAFAAAGLPDFLTVTVK